MPEIKKNNKKKQTKIRLYVSENEYETIKKYAEISNKTIAAYIKECAVNQYILQFDFDEIREHTQQISEIKASINRLIYTLVQSGNYYFNDIKNILDALEKISRSEEILIKTFKKTRESLRQELKEIINKNFQKSRKGVDEK